MPAEIVNLRKARKVRDRAAKEKRAEENRLKFGRPKVERERSRANTDAAARRLDAHQRGAGESEDGGSGPTS